MTVRQLIAALLAHAEEDFDREVYLGDLNILPVDAVESCPGDEQYGLDPYVILRGPA